MARKFQTDEVTLRNYDLYSTVSRSYYFLMIATFKQRTFFKYKTCQFCIILVDFYLLLKHTTFPIDQSCRAFESTDYFAWLQSNGMLENIFCARMYYKMMTLINELFVLYLLFGFRILWLLLLNNGRILCTFRALRLIRIEMLSPATKPFKQYMYV